jgi:hypothetical protein
MLLNTPRCAPAKTVVEFAGSLLTILTNPICSEPSAGVEADIRKNVKRKILVDAFITCITTLLCNRIPRLRTDW